MPLSAAERQARYRERNPERARAVNVRRKQKVREILLEIKRQRGCSRCGIDDPRVLDFHHVDQKDLAVSVLVYRRSLAAVLEEVERCEVLCANCHRILHAEESDKAQIAAAGFFRAS